MLRRPTLRSGTGTELVWTDQIRMPIQIVSLLQGVMFLHGETFWTNALGFLFEVDFFNDSILTV